MKWMVGLFLGCALAGSVRAADVVGYNTANGTLNLGPEAQYDSETYQSASYRFIVYQGTVNINLGASIKTGGNGNSVCNYIGVDKTSPAVVNINGGTLWCTTAGGGAGCLGIGINQNNTASTLTLNVGTLRVDGTIRSGVAWNSLNGRSNSGTVNVNGGEAFVNQFVFGGNSESTGASTLNLNGGRLTVNELNFQGYNGQTFTWGNGTLIAGRSGIFTLEEYRGTNKTRTMTITGTPATFDTAGLDQILPAFAGTGKLRLTGGGMVMFSESTLTYGLVLDGISIDLGELVAGTVPLTVANLEILGAVMLDVSLPADPHGRYPLIAASSSIIGSPALVSVNGGGSGKVVRDGNTLFLSFEEEPGPLVYSAAGGGEDTPDGSAYTRLLFTADAGAFTVAGEGLTLAEDIADMSAAKQVLSAPLTLLAENTPIYVAENGCLELNGGITAQTPVKDGPGTLVLGSDTLPATISLTEGVIDFAGQTYTGTLPLYSTAMRRGFGREITYTNGVWRYDGHINFEFEDNTLRFADGFTLDATANSDSRFAIGYSYTDWGDAFLCTKVVVDGATVNVRGNSSNTCNFIGVDRSGTGILEILRGTFHTDGYMRIAAGGNQRTIGIVQVGGGSLLIANDLWMGTVFNGPNAGQGTATFEMTGGQTTLRNFYAGATSSSVASSTVNLLGGVFEVATFTCQACCRQAVTADGVIFRARQSDNGGTRFMSAAESADSYEKSYTVGTSGLTVDTAGCNVRCSIPWTGEGGLTVTGGGSFILNQEVALAGDVTVADDTAFGTSVSQTFPGTLTLGAGAILRFDLSSLGNDTMTLATGGFVLPDGVDDVMELVELSDSVNYIAKVIDGGNTIEISSSADVPMTADWTGAAGTDDLYDPANWICRNAAGTVIPDGLPGPTTTVYVDGVTAFTIPEGELLNWVGITVGTKGKISLTADCDWSAFREVVLANGAVVDLCGHNLKVTRLSAAEDGTAVVTNSVAGVRPELRRVNVVEESDFIDTPAVTVCTDVVRVTISNEGTFSSPSGMRIGVAMDADFVQTNGTIEAGANRDVEVALGANGHAGSYSITGEGYAHLGHIHIGTSNASTGRVYVAESAKINLVGWITVGYAGGAYGEMIQDSGEITLSDDLNIGLNRVGVGTYQMNGGTLTVAGSFVPGRNSGVGTFTQRAGVVNANSYLTIGYAGGNGTYEMTGGELKVTRQPVIISQSANSVGVLDVAGGVATAGKGILLGHTSTATLRVRDGGRLNMTAISMGTGEATLELDGGTLGALGDNASFIQGVTNVVFGARGMTLDNGGYAVGFDDCTLKVTPGAPAITMTGTGTLDLSGSSVELPEAFDSALTLAIATEGVFTGVPSFDRKGWTVRLSEDGKMIRVLSPGFLLLLH